MNYEKRELQVVVTFRSDFAEKELEDLLLSEFVPWLAEKLGEYQYAKKRDSYWEFFWVNHATVNLF